MCRNRFLHRACVVGLLLGLTRLTAGAPATYGGAVGRWTFNEGAGSVVADVSGHAHTARIEGGPRWVTTRGPAGKIIRALAFLDAGRVVYGRPTAFNVPHGFSLAAWIEPTQLPRGETMLIGKDSTIYGLSFYQNGRCYLYADGGTNHVSVELPLKRWSYLVGTYDGKELRFYRNGRLVAHQSLRIVPPATHIPLVTGPSPNQQAHFTGLLAEAAIYDHALSAKEILRRFKRGLVSAGGRPLSRPQSAGATLVASNMYSLALVPADWRALTAPPASEKTLFNLLGNSSSLASAHMQSLPHARGGVEFVLSGNPPHLRGMKWALSVKVRCLAGYYTLRYRAVGINRNYTPAVVVSATGLSASGLPTDKALALDRQLINDSRWHTLIGKFKNPFQPMRISVQLATTGLAAKLALASLRFFSAPPDPADAAWRYDWKKTALPRSAFQCLNLDSRFTTQTSVVFENTLTRHRISDGIRTFTAAHLTVDGVPFLDRPQGKNLLAPRTTALNTGTVKFRGAVVSRRDFFPVSRDDQTIINVSNRKVSEAFFLLVGNLPVGVTHYGVPGAPFQINDIGALAVELQYTDGHKDFVFPYSLADHGFIVRRQAGAYVVPVDEHHRLARIILHNRIIGTTLGIAAFTLNISNRRVVPQIAHYAPVRPVPVLAAPPVQALFLSNKRGMLTLGNRFYRMTLDCRHGFSIVHTVNCWAPHSPLHITPGSGLALHVAGRWLTGRDFRTQGIQVTGTSATIQLQCIQPGIPLSLAVHVAVDHSVQLRLGLTVHNTGHKALQPMIVFPYLSGLRLGKIHDTWLYFPEYRSLWTNHQVFCRASNDRAFTVQFYDIYNPVVGDGLCVMTHNRDGWPLDYCAGKDPQGAMAAIIYPHEYYVVPPAGKLSLPGMILAFHSGDWHTALNLYRHWRMAWRTSRHSSARAWFQKVWLIRSCINNRTNAAQINHFPPMLNHREDRYRLAGELTVDRKYYGATPDMIHFYNWFFSDKLNQEMWGDYSTQSYNNAGGLPVFRSAIAKLQNKYHLPISLYLIPDRISKQSQVAQRYWKRIVQRRADGSPVRGGYEIDVNPASVWWRDYFTRTAARVRRQTGCRAIYLDVFPYSRGEICYTTRDGLKVQNWVNRDSVALLKQLRAALPPGVAMWSEMPPTDTESPYLDGNITYYFLPLHSIFAHPYGLGDSAATIAPAVQSVQRFAFPRDRQFGFPVGFEGVVNKTWRIKSLFFNGQGVLDVTFRLFPSAQRRLLRKFLQVLHRYDDCFATLAPEPLVPTLQRGVYANEFPGRQRIVWSIYNARYTPVHGAILSLPWRPGDTYKDVWNHCRLHPVIKNGRAIVSLDMQPQAVGCVVLQRAQ